MAELDNKTHEQIKKLCDEGNVFSEEQDYPAALKKYWDAWNLLPEPQTNWEAATWILVSIGDANFYSKDFNEGRDNLSRALHCPDAIGNPFLHLRLGQCLYELGEYDNAANELILAYMSEGKDIFNEDDPKYFKFLTSRAKAPPNGW